jgi:hypothetical protein
MTPAKKMSSNVIEYSPNIKIPLSKVEIFGAGRLSGKILERINFEFYSFLYRHIHFSSAQRKYIALAPPGNLRVKLLYGGKPSRNSRTCHPASKRENFLSG